MTTDGEDPGVVNFFRVLAFFWLLAAVGEFGPCNMVQQFLIRRHAEVPMWLGAKVTVGRMAGRTIAAAWAQMAAEREGK